MNKEETQTRSTIMEDKEDHAEASCKINKNFQQILLTSSRYTRMEPHRSCYSVMTTSFNPTEERRNAGHVLSPRKASLPPKSTLTDSRGDKIDTMQAPRDMAS